MRSSEFTGITKWYDCRIRVVNTGRNVVFNTTVSGDSRTGVMAMMIRLFGKNYVIYCNELVVPSST
jgi:hypothetical protein